MRKKKFPSSLFYFCNNIDWSSCCKAEVSTRLQSRMKNVFLRRMQIRHFEIFFPVNFKPQYLHQFSTQRKIVYTVFQIRLSSLFYNITASSHDKKCADERRKRKSSGSSRGRRDFLKVSFLKILFQNLKIRFLEIRALLPVHNTQCSDFPRVDQPPKYIFQDVP